MAGFLQPTEGESCSTAGHRGPGADRAVVFQKHALMPWLNVVDNVAFGLMLQGMDRARRRGALRNLASGRARRFRTTVYKLSGGMQQRVGIARALTCDPLLSWTSRSARSTALTREKRRS